MVRLIEHTLPQPSSSVLKAIMLGDKDSLPAEVKNKFLKTGTSQAVVVRGLHVGSLDRLYLRIVEGRTESRSCRRMRIPRSWSAFLFFTG